MEKDVLLRITDYVVEFKTENGTKQAINHLNLTIHKGESLGLVGEAGAGKTTTALGVLRLLPKHSAKIKSGIIEFHGEDMAKFSERRLREIRGDKISMSFQNPLTSLNPVFTVGEQIAMVLRKHKNIGNKQAMEEAGKLMETVGIAKERINDYPHQFSGGMRQRIGIAAALACSPELLIADEPTTALDVTIQAQILEMLKKLNRESGVSMLFISHNLNVVRKLCRRVAVMQRGVLVEEGDTDQVFYHPQHPYTQKLIDAIPTRNRKEERP